MKDENEDVTNASSVVKNGHTVEQIADKIEDTVADPTQPADTVDDETFRQLKNTCKLMKVWAVKIFSCVRLR